MPTTLTRDQVLAALHAQLERLDVQRLRELHAGRVLDADVPPWIPTERQAEMIRSRTARALEAHTRGEAVTEAELFAAVDAIGRGE